MSTTTQADPAAPVFLTAVPGFVEAASIGPYRLEDYLRLPDEPRVELIQGRYYVSPAPILLHQYVSGSLLARLHAIAIRCEGAALSAPCDVVVAEHTVVQPDLVYFGKGRKPPLGPRVTSPPDLVVEILSESSHARDRLHKSRLFADFGVAEYWIVDPAERSFEFFVLVDGKYQLQPQTEARYASPRLPELAIDLADFWGEVERQITPRC